MSEDKITRESVLAVEPITEHLFRLRCTRFSGFRFRAGQFARLGCDTESGRVWRAYSMVSTSFDEHLEFFSIQVPGGAFSQALARLQVGDGLWVEKQPYGYLTLDRFADGRDLWMIASGTGVAPFLSILQEPEVWTRFQRVVLIYSVRHARELAYQDVLAELPQHEYLGIQPGQFSYVPVVTREHHPDALGKRVTQLLQSGALEAHVNLPLSPEYSRVLLCGNPALVEDCREWLKRRDMRLSLSRRPGQVAVENYW